VILLGMLAWLRGMAGASATMAVLVVIFWVELYGLMLVWSPDGHRVWTLLSRRSASPIQRQSESVHPSRAEVEQVAMSILRSICVPKLDRQFFISGPAARPIGRASAEARH
jgi:hypothetical protein